MFIFFIIAVAVLVISFVIYNRLKKHHKSNNRYLYDNEKAIKTLYDKICHLEAVITRPLSYINCKTFQSSNTSLDSILLESNGERIDANRIDIFNNTIDTVYHLDRYAFALPYVKNKDVLDVASGTGYGANELSRLGLTKSITGLELNEKCVEYARAIYAPNGEINYQQGSILEMPFADNSFDIVTSFETIEHIADTKGQLSEIRRVLRPGGIYIVSTPNAYGIENPHHVLELNNQELTDLLNTNGFDVLEKNLQYIPVVSKYYGIKTMTDENKDDELTSLLYVAKSTK